MCHGILLNAGTPEEDGIEDSRRLFRNSGINRATLKQPCGHIYRSPENVETLHSTYSTLYQSPGLPELKKTSQRSPDWATL